MNDGYDHLRAQVKKLCDIAMVRVWPGKDGVRAPAQPDVAMYWMIVPEPWSWDQSSVEEIDGYEVPSVTFAVMGKELEMNLSPERIADLIQVRFQGALISLWEFVGQDIKKRNMERLTKHYEEAK